MNTLTLPGFLPDDLLPEEVEAYIAGGFAACRELADDIDVWVVCSDFTEAPELRATLLAHLKANRFAYTPLAQQETFPDNYGDMDTILKVARIPYGLKRPQPIHLLVTTLRPEYLMKRFDISTHRVALVPTRKGLQRFNGEEWTDLNEEPIALRDTPTTPARMEKIRARYAHLRGNQ